jgi:hypothetical protein
LLVIRARFCIAKSFPYFITILLTFKDRWRRADTPVRYFPDRPVSRRMQIRLTTSFE